jgi:peptidoglycan-N-acetylmuramic acid deacetylase
MFNLVNANDTVVNEEINQNIYYSGSSEVKTIYLTFDDGYSRVNTIEILNILESRMINATFFFEGDFLLNNQDLVKRAIRDGHLIGNHTYSHINATKYSKEQFTKELEKVETLFYNITKQELTKLYRPPMGLYNDSNLEVLNQKGYKVIMWNVNYPDWNKSLDRGHDYAFSEIIRQTKNGSIILMHTILKSNVDALPDIIDELKKRGFTFATLDQLYKI